MDDRSLELWFYSYTIFYLLSLFLNSFGKNEEELRQHPLARGKRPFIKEEEEQIRKVQRQEKAVHKFSKQRFMKTNSPEPKLKAEEPDPARITLLNLIKRNLKVDILERLSQLVRMHRLRVST